MEIQLKSLVDKLNDECRAALEGAAGLCLANTHYEIELEHVLIKLLEQDQTDIHIILKHYDIESAKFLKELVAAIDSFRKGNTRTPVFSPRLPKILEKAWAGASLNFNAPVIRSGHMLLTLLTESDLRLAMLESAPLLKDLPIEEVIAHFEELVAQSPENEFDYYDAPHAEGGSPAMSKMAGKTQALDQYTIDLTGKAKEGGIDPIIGRDEEIRQMVDILTRRRQNNPILTGEAGVGKTAVVEGLALRIAEGDVPPILKNVALHTLDMGLLQAGASVKGEFENRLKSVIDEVKASPHPIIMFIDEAHTMIGAGGQEGQSDAANLLKPALARGELRTIAATTWAEYKKYFEKDAALARRFQVVKIEEPDAAKAIAMLRAICPIMEDHHNVRVLDEALVDAVLLSQRYITGRQLPDKGVSVLDTACARVGLSQASKPSALENAERQIMLLEHEKRILEREKEDGLNHQDRIDEIDKEIAEWTKEKEDFEAQWKKELDLVLKIKEEREKEGLSDDEKKKNLETLYKELEELYGPEPMVHLHVSEQTVAEVISGWTGIPVGKMMADEINTILSFKEKMMERVVGQDHAIQSIARRIQTARASLDDPDRPIGVFMLVGPSGVGKTETALAISDILYGGERNLISINMSEYQEAHTVSGLKGSPPGYVGYGEGGVLTEAVRRKPYSVVLLDEVEKAHPDVLELFYQVFDKGKLDDSEGREIDFKNTVILLTSNVATETIMMACDRGKVRPDSDNLIEAIYPEMKDVFKPAFLGRMITIPYYPIADEVLKMIVNLKLTKVKNRIQENHNAELAYDDNIIQAIADRCTEVDSGARNIDMIITGTILPEISKTILERMADEKPITKIQIDLDKNSDFKYDIS